jgi:hypothetical protein
VISNGDGGEGAGVGVGIDVGVVLVLGSMFVAVIYHTCSRIYDITYNITSNSK